MTKALQMGMKYVSVFAFKLPKGKLRQPFPDKVSPVSEFRPTCSGYQANSHVLFD